MNITEFVMTGFRERDFAALSSSIDIPVMNAKYDGKSGNTQGDKNEKAPALNATKTLTGSCIEHSFSILLILPLRRSFVMSMQPDYGFR